MTGSGGGQSAEDGRRLSTPSTRLYINIITNALPSFLNFSLLRLIPFPFSYIFLSFLVRKLTVLVQ